MSKLRAYELQERGRDTLDANLELGLPPTPATTEPPPDPQPTSGCARCG